MAEGGNARQHDDLGGGEASIGASRKLESCLSTTMGCITRLTD